MSDRYPFLMIPIEMVEDDRLNSAQLILYGLIYSSFIGKSYCGLKNSYFSRIMRTSESSILRHLDTLERCGYIERQVLRREATNEVIERRIFIISKENK